MGRPTDDRKPHNLIVRINDDTKDALKRIADSKGQSVSEYMRDMIDFALHNKGNAMQNSEEKDSIVMQNLQKKIKEYEATIEFMKADSSPVLEDTLQMIRLSCANEDEADAFLKDFHDRLESGEYQIVNGKLKLGYHEVFEVLNRTETKKWLDDVWDACNIRGKTYQEGLECVFKEGSIKAVEAIYADKQGGSG